MSNRKQTALNATELLAQRVPEALEEYEPTLAVEFLISAAVLLSGELKEVDLADVLEFLDVRQHVGLTANEAAALVSVLMSRGILKLHGTRVSFTVSGWDILPRTKAKSLALAKRDKHRWLALVTKRVGK